MAGKVKPITAAGRRRVHEAIERYGLLLVQGQAEVPSVADLLEGRPITTRGYSYDYVPAWIHLHEALEPRADLAIVKLVRGRRTVVHRRHWPAVEALARLARCAVLAGAAPAERRAMLTLIEKRGRESGEEIKRQLGLEGRAGTRTFQRVKTDLERWCCVVGEDQPEAESHTHDQVWMAWADGKIGRALRRRKRLPGLDDAAGALIDAMGLDPRARPPKTTTLLPIVAIAEKA